MPSVWFGGILTIKTVRILVECQKLHDGCVHHCCSKVNTAKESGTPDIFPKNCSAVRQTSKSLNGGKYISFNSVHLCQSRL